jgi:hypothetical protein
MEESNSDECALLFLPLWVLVFLWVLLLADLCERLLFPCAPTRAMLGDDERGRIGLGSMRWRVPSPHPKGGDKLCACASCTRNSSMVCSYLTWENSSSMEEGI